MRPTVIYADINFKNWISQGRQIGKGSRNAFNSGAASPDNVPTSVRRTGIGKPVSGVQFNGPEHASQAGLLKMSMHR